MSLTPDAVEITRALQTILEPGQVAELRILGGTTRQDRHPKTWAGWFDSDHLVEMVTAAQGIHTAKGWYITPNPVDPALQARAFNRLKPCDKDAATTADTNIQRRGWLLVDCDAKRPTGISSTDIEHQAALDLAEGIAFVLREEGWPEPIQADSGNGAHLMYRVDLPADDGGLVKRCLEALDRRFSTEAVKVDLTPSNPARIWKLYGTPAGKGDDTPDRPHRMARLIVSPDNLQVVHQSLLDELAGSVAPSTSKDSTHALASGTFNIEAWIHRHGLEVEGPKKSAGGADVWTFPVCPWRDSDTGGSAFIRRDTDGTISAGCQHATCPGSIAAGGSWSSLRDKIEGPRQVAAEPPDMGPHPADLDERLPARPLRDFLLTGPELDALKIPPRALLVDPFLPERSVSMVYAARGVGKSWFSMELAHALTMGKPFFDWYVPASRHVCYLDGEMTLDMIQERLHLLYGQPLPAGLTVLPSERLWAADQPLNLATPAGQHLVQSLLDDLMAAGQRPDLLILDNLSSLCSGIDESDNTAQDAILGWLTRLKHQGLAVLLVHHAGKGGDQRGASRREDPLDAVMKLTELDGDSGGGAGFRLEFTKARGCRNKPLPTAWRLETGESGRLRWAQVKTLPEYIRALFFLRDQAPSSATELARLMDGISRQAASKHVAKLREKGLIRPMELALTDRGRAALARFEGGKGGEAA